MPLVDAPPTTRSPVGILLVEDNPDHAHLTIRALRDGHLTNEIFWVKNGEEALDFLYHRGAYGNGTPSPRPGLILLDIQLPKVDGYGVLRQIKSDDSLRSIPVVMLTTSELPDEVARSYQQGANSYVCKPVQFSAFVERVQAVQLYWTLVNVPTAA